MLWEFTHNGFHGRTKLRLRVPDGSEAGDWVQVSTAVARRLNNAVCGCEGCTCGERVAHCDYKGWRVILPEYGGEMLGRYPKQPKRRRWEMHDEVDLLTTAEELAWIVNAARYMPFRDSRQQAREAALRVLRRLRCMAEEVGAANDYVPFAKALETALEAASFATQHYNDDREWQFMDAAVWFAEELENVVGNVIQKQEV